MRGFCSTGIMLLPKDETYSGRQLEYQLGLKKSIEKAIQFFKTKGITLQCFTTDELANTLRPTGVEWLNSSTPEDLFFIKKNCEGMMSLPEGKDLADYYVKSREKYPTQRGLSLEDRFDIVIKRDKFTANKYIEKQKLVITFEHQNNPYYKVVPKVADGRIIIKVSHLNFVAQAYMSGEPIDIVRLLEYNGAARPLHSWEV